MRGCKMQGKCEKGGGWSSVPPHPLCSRGTQLHQLCEKQASFRCQNIKDKIAPKWAFSLPTSLSFHSEISINSPPVIALMHLWDVGYWVLYPRISKQRTILEINVKLMHWRLPLAPAAFIPIKFNCKYVFPISFVHMLHSWDKKRL